VRNRAFRRAREVFDCLAFEANSRERCVQLTYKNRHVSTQDGSYHSAEEFAVCALADLHLVQGAVWIIRTVLIWAM
jgi:hypothetical protein